MPTNKERSDNGDEQPARIPLFEERPTLERRTVPGKRVRVSLKTELVDDAVRDTVLTEDIEINRVPKNEEVGTVPEVRVEGDTTIVPILEEVLVVEKRLVLKEELHIRRRATNEEVVMPLTVRKQRVFIEEPLEPKDGD